eukprot:gene10848-12636_t
MELCNSGTLRSWLSKFPNNTSVNRLECKEVIKQLLIGLSHIHANGFVHRDVTPDNTFLETTPIHVKIGDFGLSTHLETLASGKSRPGLGTLLYSSPEQEQGELINQNTDVYSVGAIYYEMLCQFRTTMERIKSLSMLKKTMTLPDIFKYHFPRESVFIERILQPFTSRPSSIDLVSDDFFTPSFDLLSPDRAW